MRYILPDVEMLSRARERVVSLQAEILEARSKLGDGAFATALQLDAYQRLVADRELLVELVSSLERASRAMETWNRILAELEV